MPKPDLQEPSNDDMRELLETMLPDIDAAVRQACGSFHRHFGEDDYERFAHRVEVMLMENDYHLLRSFRHESSAQTWLFKIAWCDILDWLKERDREVSLEEAPPESSIAPPKQEEELLLKERRALMEEAARQLSERRELLYRLICEDLSAREIAGKMGIETKSFYPMRDVMIERIQEIIDARSKRAKPDKGPGEG